jgi:hypothetical protein
MAAEQGNLELGLEPPQAARDVRQHGVKLVGGAAHPAEPCDRFEDAEVSAIHDFHPIATFPAPDHARDRISLVKPL